MVAIVERWSPSRGQTCQRHDCRVLLWVPGVCFMASLPPGVDSFISFSHQSIRLA